MTCSLLSGTMLVSLYILFLTTLLSSASGLSILPSETAAKYSSFDVTCSADAIDINPSFKKITLVNLFRHKNVEGLEIGRLSLSDYSIGLFEHNSIPWKSSDTDEGKLEIFFPTSKEMDSLKNDFTKSREIMKIRAHVKNATCEDAGYYSCNVEFVNDDENNRSDGDEKGQSMFISGEISEFELVATPNNSATGNEYQDKSRIELVCTAVGPEDYKFFWTWKCPGFRTWEIWPIISDIRQYIKHPAQNGKYRQKSTLHFDMTEQLDGCKVKCKFGLDRRSTCSTHKNVHFNLKGTNQNTSSSCSSNGTVIGLAIGLAALVVFVAVLIVFIFRYQKDKWRVLSPS